MNPICEYREVIPAGTWDPKTSDWAWNGDTGNCNAAGPEDCTVLGLKKADGGDSLWTEVVAKIGVKADPDA